MRWKEINNSKGLYKISDSGEVMSFHTYNKMKPKLKCQTLSKRGYYTVDLYVDHKRKNAKVHRLVAQAFVANPNSEMVVNHIDGNKLNNRYDNLEWCSTEENTQHALKNGLIKKYNHENAPKLTPELAVAIFMSNGSHRTIAKKFKVGTSTVAHIKRGSRWGKFTNGMIVN